MELVLITGRSGAGKTRAAACLEDMGYYCVDNLPPSMLNGLVLELKKDNAIKKVAVVIDVRSRQFFLDLGSCLEDLKELGVSCTVIFLEADEKTLLRRYQETKRVHPLAADTNTEKAIKEEAALLEDVKKRADYVIDTTNLKSSELNMEIGRVLGGDPLNNFRVSIFSFGYKYGMPAEADWVVDARFIPNPYYVESLKRLTGKNKKVKEFVLGFAETQRFIADLTGTILELIPKYIREGKYHLNIAIGCTGGQHRSVVVAEELAAHLNECGQSVTLSHRELK